MNLGNNTVLCGNVENAAQGVTMGNNSQVVQSLAGTDCSSTANVLSGGSIVDGGTIEGDATASAPTQQNCPPTPNTLWSITGGNVNGTATACGIVTSTTPNPQPATVTSPPAT